LDTFFFFFLGRKLQKNVVNLAVSAETKEVKTAEKQAPAKAKPPAKAPTKPLPQLMEEDVIPSLKAILEAQHDLSEIELSFQDDRVSFLIYRILFWPKFLLD
jgi:hypothetical protein